MGRERRYRQKRHEEAHSLYSKSLFGLLAGELRKAQVLSQKEAKLIALPCYIYLTQTLCKAGEGQIAFDIMEGLDNHDIRAIGVEKRKKAILTPIAVGDIELMEEFGITEMQNARILRLIEEAYLQGGLLDMRRLSLLLPLTNRALRERLKAFWRKGVFAPLAGMALKHREEMSRFRQSLCIEGYISGVSLKSLQREFAISMMEWERILSVFRYIAHNEGKDIRKLAKVFGVPLRLVREYREIAAKHSECELLRKKPLHSFPGVESPGDVSSRSKFISELIEKCAFSPALADRVERDLREIAQEIDQSQRKENEIIYYAISDQEPAGKPLAECELIPVRIEYHSPEDEDVFSPDSTSLLKWRRAIRYTTQVRYQGALLNQVDIAFLLGLSPAVLQRLTRKNKEIVIPTRGNMCDMGPAVSHAEEIISLYLQGFTETQINRRTAHDYRSIERYIEAFTRMVGLLESEGLKPAEIRKVLGCSRRLVERYINLYQKYNTAEYQWWMDQVRLNYCNLVKKNRKEEVDTLGKRRSRSRFFSFPEKTPCNFQVEFLKQEFELAERSFVGRAVVNHFSQISKHYEKNKDIKRLAPGEVLFSFQEEEITLPLIDEECIEFLAQGGDLRSYRDILQQKQFEILKETCREATLKDLWTLINHPRFAVIPTSRTLEGILPPVKESKPGIVQANNAGAEMNKKTLPEETLPQDEIMEEMFFFAEELGLKPTLARAMTLTLHSLRENLFPNRENLKAGQAIWMARSTKYKPRWGKRTTDYLQPALITLYTPEEVGNPTSCRALLKKREMERLARITSEAYLQDAVFSLVDLELLMNRSASYLKELLQLYRKHYNMWLPTAGTILDMGRSVSHKVEVIELNLNGLKTEKIAYRLFHSNEAVDRYIDQFQKIALLHLKYNMSERVIAYILNCSRALVTEYIKIAIKYRDYLPDSSKQGKNSTEVVKGI